MSITSRANNTKHVQNKQSGGTKQPKKRGNKAQNKHKLSVKASMFEILFIKRLIYVKHHLTKAQDNISYVLRITSLHPRDLQLFKTLIPLL